MPDDDLQRGDNFMRRVRECLEAGDTQRAAYFMGCADAMYGGPYSPTAGPDYAQGRSEASDDLAREHSDAEDAYYREKRQRERDACYDHNHDEPSRS